MIPKFRGWIPSLGHEDEYPSVGKMYYWKLNFQSRGAQEAIDNNTVMMSTGLHDKNGLQEVYEGDIVETDENYTGGVMRGEVVFLFGAWYVNTIEDGLYDIREYIKIIGNIYEDKSLIK